MAHVVELAARAERDLDAIYERIHPAESRAAARWYNGLERSVYSLADMPQRCPDAPEGRKTRRPLRHLLCGKKPHIYRLIFDVDERQERVTVLTIRHGARESATPEELL